MASIISEVLAWWQGKKTIVGGLLVMLAAVWAVAAGVLDAQTGLALLGVGLGIAGMAAKAERHQAELLAVLQGVARAGVDYRAGGGAGAAIADMEATAKAELPAALSAEIARMDALRRGIRDQGSGVSGPSVPPPSPGWDGPRRLFGVLLVTLFCAGALMAQGTLYSPGRSLENIDSLEIGLAQKSVDLAAYSLTDRAVVEALADRARHGVTIRIYLDRGEVESECRADINCARISLHELIGLPGVEIRVKYSKVLMHLKSYCVDGKAVRDGSANFSEQGEGRQDNSATFSTDPEAVREFQAKFAEMWLRPDNLTVAEAVAGAKK
jgi:hypothetical protein